MQLVLRRASISRLSGTWSEHDYDVFDGDRDVDRIYQVPKKQPLNSSLSAFAEIAPSF